MPQHTKKFRNRKQSKIVFILSVLVAAYWYIGKAINVHQYKILDVVFEVLWLPMIILLFALPIVSLGFFVKDKFNMRSLYLYSLLVGAGAILITVFM